jgi:D-alanyl-D-alanine carboxypeptidase
VGVPSRFSAALASLTVVAAAHGQTASRAALVQRIDSIVSRPMSTGNIAGMAVAVIKGRDTLLMKGYGMADLENQIPVTAQTVFRIGSITKQFTSSAVMQLVEQGKVSLDDEMTKYIPSYPTRGRKILVRHLLNHTSGIPSYTDIGPRFRRVARTDLARDSLVALIANDSLLFEPGSHFYYNNTGYYMLGMLLEKVTGKPYGEYLAERLFAPNGLTATYYCDTRHIIPRRAQGYDRDRTGFVNTDFISMELPYAAGSLCSTVGDLVHWTQQLSSGAVVNAASYREMTTPVKLPSGRPMNYGFGLTSDTIGGRRVISHGGGINGFVSLLMYVPQDSLVVAVLANTSPAPSDAVAAAITRAVLGVAQPQPAAPKTIALSAAERASYVGSYVLTRPDASKSKVRVSEENGELMLQPEGQTAAKMTAQGNHVFVAQGAGRLTFDVVNGRATGFVMGGGGRPLEAVRAP